nr:MAG TPA: hypothetical protein [Caudoviricetes sp.]
MISSTFVRIMTVVITKKIKKKKWIIQENFLST